MNGIIGMGDISAGGTEYSQPRVKSAPSGRNPGLTKTRGNLALKGLSQTSGINIALSGL